MDAPTLNESHIGSLVRIDFESHTFGIGTHPGGAYTGEVVLVQESVVAYGVTYRVFFKDVTEPVQFMRSSITKITVFEEKSDVA